MGIADIRQICRNKLLDRTSLATDSKDTIYDMLPKRKPSTQIAMKKKSSWVIMMFKLRRLKEEAIIVEKRG